MTNYRIAHAVCNGTTLPNVLSQAVLRNRTIISGAQSIGLHETFHSELRAASGVRLTTTALQAWQAVMSGSLLEAPWVNLDGAAGLVLYGLKGGTSGPGLAAGTSHERWTALNGALFFRSLAWNDGDVAQASYDALFTSTDGATAMLTQSSAVAAPTAQLDDERWVLSSLTIGGSAVAQVRSLTISVDPRAQQRFNAGLRLPQVIVAAPITGPVQWRMEYTTPNEALQDASGQTVVATFTKMQQALAGLGVDVYTFTFNNSLILAEEAVSGASEQEILKRFTILPRHDGTNRPVAWAA